jgi:hypothetical protein
VRGVGQKRQASGQQATDHLDHEERAREEEGYAKRTL